MTDPELASALHRASHEVEELMAYAPAMMHWSEGQVHLRLILEESHDALEWAKAHCA